MSDKSVHAVLFVFTSRGIGGAEQSMLRLIEAAHGGALRCALVTRPEGNREVEVEARRLGVPCYRVGQVSVVGYMRVFRCANPDVIYLFGRIRSLPAAFAGWLSGKCVVGSERSIGGSRPLERAVRRVESFLVRGYVANSNVGAEVLKRSILERRPIFVVRNGIRMPPFRTGRKGDGKPPRILCVANITENKGQVVLGKAIGLLRSEFQGITTTFVGRDLTAGRVLSQLESLGLSGCCRFVGATRAVDQHLAEADVFVLPTVGVEGMPTALLEAMANGVPVIATRVGGVAELVEDNKTGLLVRPSDPEALADAIRRLLRAPELGRKLAMNARSYVEATHTIQRMVEEHVRAFATVVG